MVIPGKISELSEESAQGLKRPGWPLPGLVGFFKCNLR
jgi:hypothetical protein